MINIANTEIKKQIKTVYDKPMPKEITKLIEEIAENTATIAVNEFLNGPFNEAVEIAKLNDKAVNMEHLNYVLKRKEE